MGWRVHVDPVVMYSAHCSEYGCTWPGVVGGENEAYEAATAHVAAHREAYEAEQAALESGEDQGD